MPNILTLSLPLRTELSDAEEILTSRTHSRLRPSPSCPSEDPPGHCHQEQPALTDPSQEGRVGSDRRGALGTGLGRHRKARLGGGVPPPAEPGTPPPALGVTAR